MTNEFTKIYYFMHRKVWDSEATEIVVKIYLALGKDLKIIQKIIAPQKSKMAISLLAKSSSLT